jgi:hypothetical protein
MSFNGSGSYNLPSPEYPAVSGTDILASDFNKIVEDLAAALSLTLLRDGQATMLANLKMGGFKVTGSADGSANTDLATVGQMTAAIAAASSSNTPVGAIIAWCGGYFSNTANGSITSVLGNTIAAANSYLNASGWYVCDGSALNDADSPIFNGGGRHLPNLTDSRFIMGSIAAGTVGGNSSSTHTHTLAHTHNVDIGAFNSHSTALTVEQMPYHTHVVTLLRNVGGSLVGDHEIQGPQGSDQSYMYKETTGAGSGWGHIHTVDPPNTTSSAASTTTTSATENRPQFLSTFYIMKVK